MNQVKIMVKYPTRKRAALFTDYSDIQSPEYALHAAQRHLTIQANGLRDLFPNDNVVHTTNCVLHNHADGTTTQYYIFAKLSFVL